MVAATPSSRDWVGILISILVILSIIGMVALVIRLLPPDISQSEKRKPISINEFAGGAFTPNRIDSAWIEGQLKPCYFDKGLFIN